MTGYVLKWVALAIAILVVGVIGIAVFTNVWLQVGLGVAILVVCSPLFFWAWHVDRKEKARREALEDI